MSEEGIVVPLTAAHTEPEEAEERGTKAGLSLLAPHFEPPRFPGRQLVGYAASLVLTVAALLLVRRHVLPPATLLPTILVLAGLQAATQLGLFMHLRESRGPTWHVPVLGTAICIALGIVGFSIWIMTFKFGVS